MSEHDPLQSLWKSQKQEDFSMSLADIHARAERFQTRIRVRNWIEYAAAAFVIAAFGYFALTMPDWLVRAGAALIMAGALYVAWKLNAIARAGAKDDAASWADFHRAELVRQRDALRSVWRWYLGPFVPGMVVFLAGVAFAPDAAAPLAAKAGVFALGIAVIGAIFWLVAQLNVRAAAALDKEIAALDRARGD
jgi:hypothetical protein